MGNMTPEEEQLYDLRRRVTRKGAFFHPDWRVERSSDPKTRDVKWEFVMPTGFGQTRRFASADQVMEHLGLQDSGVNGDSTGKDQDASEQGHRKEPNLPEKAASDEPDSAIEGGREDSKDQSEAHPKHVVEYEDDDETPSENGSHAQAHESSSSEDGQDSPKAMAAKSNVVNADASSSEDRQDTSPTVASPKSRAVEFATRPSGPATPIQAPPERPRTSYESTSPSLSGNNQANTDEEGMDTDQPNSAKADLEHLQDFMDRTEKALSEQQSESESIKDTIREHEKLLNSHEHNLRDNKKASRNTSNEMPLAVNKYAAGGALLLAGLLSGLGVRARRRKHKRHRHLEPPPTESKIRPPQWTAKFFQGERSKAH